MYYGVYRRSDTRTCASDTGSTSITWYNAETGTPDDSMSTDVCYAGAYDIPVDLEQEPVKPANRVFTPKDSVVPLARIIRPIHAPPGGWGFFRGAFS